MESDEALKIRVKSASHRCEDIEINCKPTTTIKNIKEIIKTKHPFKPETNEQRLIYAGHLMEDQQFLKDILGQNNQSGGGYIFHLACNSSLFKKPEVNKNLNSSNKSGIETNFNQSNPITSNFISSPVSNQQQTENGMPQGMLALHQYYVEQMMGFMTQWNQGNVGQVPSWTCPNYSGMRAQIGIPPINLMQSSNSSESASTQQAPQPPVEEQIPPAAAAQPPPPPRVQADDDEQPRDIIDWIYTCSRLILILSVVYFYSNFARFVLVLLFSALVMLAQRRPGLFNFLRREEPPLDQQEQDADQPQRERRDAQVNPVNHNAEQNHPIPNESGAQEMEEVSGIPPFLADELVQAEAQQEQQPRLHPFDVTRTFLMTFFTSLIPEINVN